jgi:CubicO group peptidase (beta-lactamase class C family)
MSNRLKSLTVGDAPRLTRRRALQGVAGLSMLTAAGLQRAAAQDGTLAALSPATDGEIVADLEQFIAQQLGIFGVPGAAVALVRGGQMLLAKGYGVREIGGAAAVGPDTVFQLASNSKPMTAAALGVLVDAGDFTFDTPVIDLLPEFALSDPYATRNCTLRDLLAHRSGLPAFSGDLLDHLGYRRMEILRRVRFMDIGNAFREAARYSNVGYFVAGEALAR